MTIIFKLSDQFLWNVNFSIYPVLGCKSDVYFYLTSLLFYLLRCRFGSTFCHIWPGRVL